MAGTLFPSNEEQEERSIFIQAVLSGESGQDALVWLNQTPETETSSLDLAKVFFDFASIVPREERPGKSTLHENGDIYCLDTSSLFAAAVLSAVDCPIENILDVCASPGGKAITAWRHLKPH